MPAQNEARKSVIPKLMERCVTTGQSFSSPSGCYRGATDTSTSVLSKVHFSFLVWNTLDEELLEDFSQKERNRGSKTKVLLNCNVLMDLVFM